jgi:hypothetical protein
MNSPKYNRTPHFPWSKGCTNDDKIAEDISSLISKRIVITEKMDGSNTSLEAEGCFARTHAGPPTHLSFDGLKALHANIKYKIPSNIQLFGEWCYALHSIAYSKLPAYFLLFNVRNLETNTWSSWEEVELWADEIGVPTVPLLFKGTCDSEVNLQKLTEKFMIEPSICGGLREGIVARVESEFSDDLFSKSIAKNVRKNHVQTSEHWKDQEIIKNKLI